MQPKISVIVPVYNVEEYLPQCLDSLINQTLKDIEIICVNDGSTDNCLEILQAFAERDNRIKVIDQENRGQGIARNRGIDLARGEYIGFVDPDDWVINEMYAEMYNKAITLNSDIVICNSVRKQYNGHSWKINYMIKAVSKTCNKEIKVDENRNIEKSVIYDTLMIAPHHAWNKIYKASLIKENKIRFSDLRCFEDCIFVLKSLIEAERVSYISQPFYKYMVRKQSTSIKINNRFELLLNVISEMKEYCDEKHLTNELQLNFDYFSVMNFIWTWNNVDRKEKKKMLGIAREKLSNDNMSEIRRYLKIRKVDLLKRFMRCCFSVTNSKDKKRKIINIFGFKIKIKKRNIQEKKERRLIAKIKHNQKKYPKDSYLLFDCLNGDISECIDAYSLFRYMRGVGKKAYYVIMKEHPLYKQLEKENNLEGIIALEKSMKDNPGDFLERVYEILLSSKAIITAFDVYSGKSRRFIKKNKYWQYIFIQHGPTFLKETVLQNGYISENKWDRILISSEYEKRALKKYGWQDEKMIKIGLPRWDLLQAPLSSTERSIFVMFTWRRFGREEFDHSLYKENLLKMLYNEKLHNYLKQHNIKVYFAPHHSLMGLRGISFSPSTENVICVDPNECSKYIRKCSMLITDYSSVTFDFMFQNKPVILYLLDKNDKNLNKWDKEDLRHFEYKKYLIPNVIFDESKLIEKIKYYVEHNFQLEPDVQYKYDSFFYTKDHICQRLTREIDSACENNLKQ